MAAKSGRVNHSSAISGRVIASVTHSPWRTMRRIWRGWRAPLACAISGAVALATPIPNIIPVWNSAAARVAAASGAGPSLDSNRTSVVWTRIWISCVSTSGSDSASIAKSSRASRFGAASGGVAVVTGMESMAR